MKLIKIKPSQIVAYPFLVVFVCFSVFPIFWMVSSAIKPSTEIYSIPPKIFTSFTLQHFRYMLFETHTIRYFLNSLIVASITTLISLSFALPGGYGLARFNFKMKNAISIAILFSQMLPLAVLLIPLYMVLAFLGLLDTYLGLILTYLGFAIPLTTWLLRGFFAGIPKELEEAAMIDGCTRFQALMRVLVPVAMPAIIATGVYSFMVAWEEFLFALSFTSSDRVRTLPIGINSFIGEYGVDWGAVMASSTLASLPIIVLFMIFYEQFISTFTEGMIKG
ncbi:MAG: multiple sugar transport system permease protein [Candidatus Atribacteria bacterium]|nr:multiple sugar transport system permease protein [Candidatus Atribacteria bacterium]